MRKPTVYLDTSIISAFWYEGNDLTMAARRLHTREWWDMEREHFSVWASEITLGELEAGIYRRQTECVEMARRLRHAHLSSDALSLAEEILQRRIVPPTKSADATHLAISAARNMDYLLTWNYAHMANPQVQAQFEVLCKSAGLVAPLMVSPESIPQVRFGKSIRRKR